MRQGPSPDTRYPVAGVTRTGFLKAFITRPNIIVGDYTYYDDPRGPERFEANVLYHFDFIGDRLVIGKFCSIAAEVRFIMNGGNHPVDRLSTYPFAIFGHGWEDGPAPPRRPSKGDTRVGHDVWIGHGATIMPGVNIGNGAIVGTAAVVTRDVLPYAIVGGNPARIIRMRFDAATVDGLQAIQWWDWDAVKITRHRQAIAGADLDALEQAARADP